MNCEDAARRILQECFAVKRSIGPAITGDFKQECATTVLNEQILETHLKPESIKDVANEETTAAKNVLQVILGCHLLLRFQMRALTISEMQEVCC